MQPIFDRGLAELVEMNHRISPEIRLTPTPGHTPGHVSVLIESNGQRAMITGDMLHHPCQFGHPEWSPSFDSDPVAGASMRRSVIRAKWRTSRRSSSARTLRRRLRVTSSATARVSIRRRLTPMADDQAGRHRNDNYGDNIAARGGGEPAIPAATVVLLRDYSSQLEVLMLHKASQIAFGGMWVFPGGRIDDADYDTRPRCERRRAQCRRA